MLAVLVAFACAWFDAPAYAQAPTQTSTQAQSKPPSEQTYDFDIPRTSRVQAIRELSRQAGGLLLGYLSNDTAEEEMLVGPVKGKQTVEDALRVILRSAMLTFRWVENDILSVEPIKIKQNAVLEDELMNWSDLRWREEITVTAWALRDLTLSVAPTVIVERQRLDETGAPTLAEALRYISQSAYTRAEGSKVSGAQYAELRGLGPDTALILINGRRALPSANSLLSSAFDLNTIPITAVQRLELLLDSGTAAHGTDAIGGIINIVLRKNVPEPKVEIRYGAAEGGAEQKRMTFSGGWATEQFHSALVLDYFDLGGLLGSERALWSNQDFRRFGGRDQRSRISSVGNINSQLPGNLPGLTSSFAAVPLVDTTLGVSVDDFRPTAGTSNLESMFSYWSVVPEATRASVVGTSSYDFTEKLAASAEVLYVNRDATFYFSPPLLNGARVPASNAYNPFGVPVLATRMLSGMGPQHQSVESELLRAALSLNGRWAAWNWELSAVYSDEDAATWLYNEFDPAALMSALSNSDPTRALNLFQNGSVGSPELLNGLRAPRHVDEFGSTGTQFAGYLDGPLWSLPAGPMRAMVGGEWREESAVFGSRTGSFDEGRDIAAAFAQLRVPIIDLGMDVPMVHELSFNIGSRWDDYEDIGNGIRSQYGLVWKPHPYVTVKASRGRSFRPPSLYELYLPDIQTVARLSDPARRDPTWVGEPPRYGEPVTVLNSFGGNPELSPVRAKTLTAGIEFSPDTAMNWNLSANYWRITMDNRVLLLTPVLLLANESLFPERFERAAQTDTDLALNQPGRLLSIDSSRVNVGNVEVSGVDFAIRSDFQTSAGRFVPELLATWFDRYSSTDIPGRPAQDRVDLASEVGTILSWRAIFSLGWKRGPFGINSAARFTPEYNDAVAGTRTGRKVARQTLVDLQGSVDFGRWFGASSRWSGFKLAIGATNVFDAEPNFAAVGDAAGFDMSQGDLKQRSYYLRLEKSFTQ